MGRRLALIGAVALPALVAGCGSSTLDSSKAVQTIESGIQQATGEHVTATCPSNIPVSKGHTTVCTVTAADGTKATVQIVQRNTNGNVSFTSPVVNTLNLEQQIATSAERQSGATVKVTCPDLYEVTHTPQLEQCKATTQKGTSVSVPVTVTQSGGQFHFHWHFR